MLTKAIWVLRDTLCVCVCVCVCVWGGGGGEVGLFPQGQKIQVPTELNIKSEE